MGRGEGVEGVGMAGEMVGMDGAIKQAWGFRRRCSIGLTNGIVILIVEIMSVQSRSVSYASSRSESLRTYLSVAWPILNGEDPLLPPHLIQI